MKINLGAGLHWTDSSFDETLAYISLCESLGYEQLWVANEKFFHEMYVTSSAAAMHTSRIKIGTFIADPYTYHPALTSIAIGTLDEVSRGRAILGIGAGGTGFPEMGIKRAKPAQAVKEAVLVIRRLLNGERVDFQGKVIHVNHCKLNFVTRKDIPIIVASRGDMVLQAAGEVADGVMIATYAEPIGIKYAMERVASGARKAGRKLKDLTLISRVDACISKDRHVAIEAVKHMVGIILWTSYPDRKFVHRVGLEVPDELEEIIARRDYNLMAENTHLIPESFVDKFCWAGTAEEVANKVADVARLGINNITFLPHAPHGGNTLDTVREFAETVKPTVEEMLV